MPQPFPFYTADMVRALNDKHHWRWPRYEVVDGELLVSPSPRKWHQVVVRNMCVALHLYLDRGAVGTALMAPADISWGPRRLVQPDVFALPLDEARAPEWSEVRHLLLAVEVLSPGTGRADRVVKRRLYQEQGVPLYWIVDGDAHAVEVWTPEASEARIARDALTWHPLGAPAPFTLALDELFRPV